MESSGYEENNLNISKFEDVKQEIWGHEKDT
jgi:hypothetical protein